MTDFTALKDLVEQGNASFDAKTAQLEARLADIETKASRPRGSFANKSDQSGLIGMEVKKLIQFFETGEGLDRKGITSTGTGAAGGFALPEVIDITIMDQLRNISPIRNAAIRP
jgi:HK97 family phage major capsid protein